MKTITLDGEKHELDLTEYTDQWHRLYFFDYAENALVLVRQDFDQGNDSLLSIDVNLGTATELNIDQYEEKFTYKFTECEYSFSDDPVKLITEDVLPGYYELSHKYKH